MGDVKFDPKLVEPFHPGLLAYVLAQISGIPLTESIRAIQAHGRKIRPLLGPNSIMDRTLGMDAAEVSDDYIFIPRTARRTYFDSDKKAEAETEFAEAEEAIRKLATPVTARVAVDALLEIGDIEYQRGVISASHSDHPDKKWAISQIHQAYCELHDRLAPFKLGVDEGQRLGAIKYAIRGIVLNTGREFHGQPNKDTKLEDAVCLYSFLKDHPDFVS